MTIKRNVCRLLRLLMMSLAGGLSAHAEQLPVKTYTTADGLPSDAVTRIRQDSRGFVWMVVGDGISRFDGYKFRNYTTADGLADRRVNDLLETHAGVYWIATEKGLCRFNPMGAAKAMPDDTAQDPKASGANDELLFTTYNPQQDHPTVFNVLLEDDSGAIWCGTSEGLYKLEVAPNGAPRFQFVEAGMKPEVEGDKVVTAILKDRHGAVWCGTKNGVLYRRLPDARVERYTPQQHGLSQSSVLSLLEDREGNIWVGSQGAKKGGSLHRLIRVPDLSRPIVAQTYGDAEALPSHLWVTSVRQTRDGKIWAATNGGLYSSSTAGDAAPFAFSILQRGKLVQFRRVGRGGRPRRQFVGRIALRRASHRTQRFYRLRDGGWLQRRLSKFHL